MRRWRLRVLLISLAASGALVAPGPVAAADGPDGAPAARSGDAAGASDGAQREGGGPSAAQPRMTTRILRDGTVIRVVDPEAFQAIRHAAGEGCGRECGGKDPATYIYRGPGGPSHWGTCSADAFTVQDIEHVELRYSPRCATAWARGRNFYYLRTDSFLPNGNRRTFTEAFRNPHDPNGSHWTAMVDDDGLLASACAGWWGRGWEERCTLRY